MAKQKPSAKPKPPSKIAEFLAFVEEYKDKDLLKADYDRMLDLDLAAAKECKKRGIAIRDATGSRFTTYMKLQYGEKSIYEYPGNMDLQGPGNRPAEWPYQLLPDDDWLNWLRAVVRQLGETKPEKPIGRRATVATKIEVLKKELKDHLAAAKDFAYSTKDETGTPQLLPRPLEKELAKSSGMKPYDVTRCLQDPEAAELKLYWDIAADLDKIMSFSAL